AFAIEGVGIYFLYLWGADPFWFVLLSGLVFFAWGEIYSLFPSTATDTFGSKFATTNAGLLYTAKGTAALLVPYANTLHGVTGSDAATSKPSIWLEMPAYRSVHAPLPPTPLRSPCRWSRRLQRLGLAALGRCFAL